MARPGRPTVEIILSAEERSTLQRWARRHSSSQALALRSQDRVGLRRRGSHPRRDRRRAGLQPGDGGQVAAPLRRRPPRRTGRRPPAGGGPHDRRRRHRSDGRRDPRDRTTGCDALVEPGPGRPPRDLPHHGAGDLAGVRAQAVARTRSRSPPTPTWSDGPTPCSDLTHTGDPSLRLIPTPGTRALSPRPSICSPPRHQSSLPLIQQTATPLRPLASRRTSTPPTLLHRVNRRWTATRVTPSSTSLHSAVIH